MGILLVLFLVLLLAAAIMLFNTQKSKLLVIIFIVFLISDLPIGAGSDGCSWNGTWTTTWGEMKLTQVGSGVSGTYERDNGRISGTASGDTLNGVWSEAPTYSKPDDAGEVRLRMSPDCNSFEGEWRYGPESIWGWWTWKGRRVMPLEVVIDTDKDVYEQGEAVVITAQVLYEDRPIAPAKNTVLITLEIPNCNKPEEGRMFDARTDDQGYFSIMPFAGWNTGEYKVHAQAKIGFEGRSEVVEAETTFEVEEAVPGSLAGPKFAEIISLYESEIPEGPVRRMGLAPPGTPESGYGIINNLNDDLQKASKLAGGITKGLPKIPGIDYESFVCGGYQGQVLAFFDDLRFNEDPEKRELLKGLDYGPIARGAYIFGGHHAVVLYPIGRTLGTWNMPGVGAVFDPWPTQKPEIYNVDQFSGFWGNVRLDESHWARSEDVWSGWPLTGNEIYANPNLKAKKTKSAIPASGVYINCPVNVLITDSAGRRTGVLPDGTLVQDFSAWVYHVSEDGNDFGWYFGLPEDFYSLVIAGKSTGTFRLRVIGELAGGQALDYGDQPNSEGAQARITLDAAKPAAPLLLPNGTEVYPEVISEEGEEVEEGRETTSEVEAEVEVGDARTWYNEGIALDSSGRYEEAIECYDRAIEIDPQYARAFNNRGADLLSLKRYDDAIESFDEAISIDPNYAEAWNNKGVALGYQGEFEDAIDCFEEAIEIDPFYREAWNNMGNAHYYLGNYGDALYCYDTATTIDISDSNAWRNKGHALQKLGRSAEAQEAYNRASELEGR